MGGSVEPARVVGQKATTRLHQPNTSAESEYKDQKGDGGGGQPSNRPTTISTAE